MGFFRVKIFFLASRRSSIFVLQQLVANFFFYNNNFFRHKVLSKYYSAHGHVIDRNFFSIKFPDRNPPPPPKIAPPPSSYMHSSLHDI